MSRFFALVLALYVLQLSGCAWSRVDKIDQVIEASHDRPLPTDTASLKKELAETRDREARLVLAIKHAQDDATQLKLWLGVGAAVLAGMVLVAIGIWTTRRVLVEVGLGAFGVAGLLAVAAWLVPYALWIGIAITVIVIGVAVYMLINREKAVKQIAAGVTASEERIPEFAAQFRRIFNEHIDTGVDNVIKTVRGVR